VRRWTIAVLALAGCGGGTDVADTDGNEDYALVPLDPAAHLNRVSMALRGLRPSAEELASVTANPDALENIVDAYMTHPNFGAVVRDLHNDSLLSRVDYFVPPAGFLPKGPVATADVYDLNRSVMDAPLRLAEYVVMEDRPYGELVTADYTIYDEQAAALWIGLDWSTAEPWRDGWAKLRWEDDRLNAGILTDSWLFVRHDSTVANRNRGRANAITSALLCEDFLARPVNISTDVDLADPDAVSAAVQDDPACVSCHQTLDPLASFLSGWFPQIAPFAINYPFDMYSDGINPLIYGTNLRDPAYFGVPGDGLPQLGTMIAGDPRFTLCAAQRFYAYFHQVPVEEVPREEAKTLQQILVDTESAKAVIRAIMLSPEFAASHVDAPEDAELEARLDAVGVKMTRPVQLGMFFEAVTGLRWTLDLTAQGLGRPDLMDDSFVGFQMLGGGLDGFYVTRPTNTHNATSSLLLRSLARDGAAHVVAADFAEPDRSLRKLMTEVDDATDDEATVRRQLVVFHERVYGELLEVDDPIIDESVVLYEAARDRFAPGLLQPSAAEQPWIVTLMAMLQDGKVAFH
jgi:hypothetical protein